MSITKETRRESYIATLPIAGAISVRILAAVIAAPDGMTAEEVQRSVGCSLNSSRSRLTELNKSGKVETRGKRRNAANTRDIAVYYYWSRE